MNQFNQSNAVRRSQRIAERVVQANMFCPICSRKSNDYMVQCDQCKGWYHHECVGLTERIARRLPNWYCSFCQSKSKSNEESFADSMLFNPYSNPSSTMMPSNNQTVVHIPKSSDDASKRLVHTKNTLTNFEASEVVKQADELELEINKTLVQLNELMMRKKSEKPRGINLANDGPVQRSTSMTSIASATSSIARSERDSKNESKSIRANLLSQQKRELQMKLDEINEQLKYASLSNVYSVLKETGKKVKHGSTTFNGLAPRNNFGEVETSNFYKSSPVRNEIKCQEEENVDQPLNMNHWMARQTVQPLPIFDGKPEDWQMFKSAFDRTTRLCCFSNDENLDRLQHSLKGTARQLVQGQFYLPKCVPQIIKNLEQAFGRPDQLLNVYLQKIRNQNPPQGNKPETLLQFAMSVRNLWSMMEASNFASHMNNPTILQELVSKLPLSFQYQWASHILNMPSYGMSTFTSWLDTLVQKTTLIMPNIEMFPVTSKGKDEKLTGQHGNNAKKSQKTNERVHQQDVKPSVLTSCLVCNGYCKQLSDCVKFIGGTQEERWQMIKSKGICKQCLKRHPFNRGYKCKGLVKCNVENCEGRHHPLMHRVQTLSPRDSNRNDEGQPSSSIQKVNSYNQRVNYDKPQLRYIPIILRNGGNYVKDFAFLDEGSTGTLMELSLANELNLSGVDSTLYVEYTAKCFHTEPNKSIEGVTIVGTYPGAKKFYLSNVQTVQTLGLARQSLDYVEVASEFHSLKGLPVQSYNEVRPRLLIGLNNWRCAIPSKVRYEDSRQPMAAKCLLGWSIFAGGMSEKVNTSVNYHHHIENTFNDSLRDSIKYYFSIDSLGVKPPHDDIDSLEDRKANAILRTNTIKVGNQYQTSLLWKHQEIMLPNNSEMALKRLFILESKMKKQPDFAKAFHFQIAENLNLGYIRKLTKEEIDHEQKRIWYLPLLPIRNPNKPGKIRVVYDAAATVDGVSLNSALMKGPDPVNTLLGVLLRFRQQKIGIVGDITHMFSQIRICPEDQHVQRFFYRENPSEKLDVYVLQVMSFGATCSPASATFVKNHNAEQYRQQFPRAFDAITQNHYVDDMLDGANNIEDVIKLVQEVKYIHSQAGFHIGKWKSNSREVMETLGSLEQDKIQINMNFEECDNEKILGMWWDLRTDCFTYSLRFNKGNSQVLNGDCIPTKRDMLKILMSIFDPLGLIAHFLAYLKVLIQDVWRTSREWDEPINLEQSEKWQKWISKIDQLQTIRIPRCYFVEPSTSWKNMNVQLHTFVDASIDCAAAVTYLRVSCEDEVSLSIVSAKTKVAPIKLVSIPRLELTAALIGSRLANSIKDSLTVKIDKMFYWSDSKTVLCWLRNDTKKIKGDFVKFRVSEIQDTTNVADWRYVPSRLNVADDATKWNSLKLSNDDRWFNGPPFLLHLEETWPVDITVGCSTAEEIKVDIIMAQNVNTMINVKFDRFSRWKRLVRSMAYVYRYCDNLYKRIKGDVKLVQSVEYLTSEELAKAERYIFQVIQRETWPDEMIQLENKMCITNTKSKIYNLLPVLIDGIMHVKGRTGAILNVRMPNDECVLESVQPIILSGKHYAARLLIQYFHEKYMHMHDETVVNEMRQRYHISKLRQVLKKVKRSCPRCKFLMAKPNAPKMADLPQCRLMPYSRPFTYIGVDCLGPIEVSLGRRREKRWICLFTCLTVRAVHLEVLHRMDHDSFILAFRCFTQDRGQPKEVYSDNGTNFVKAEHVLREDLKGVNMEVIAQHFESSQLKWYFNPPASPHMGGSWERLVKSVKRAFYSIPYHKTLNDQLLYSFIKEIQNIINTRPLTYLPLDSEESAALTPNHFIRGDSSGGHPIGHFSDDAKVLKWNYEMSQLHANRFWKRWLVEYMPELTRRSKWVKSADPLKIGDLVLIVDPDYTRNCWQRGIVEKVHTAKDGQVRSAVIRTKTGFLTRPAVKLAKLDVYNCDLTCRPSHQSTEG